MWKRRVNGIWNRSVYAKRYSQGVCCVGTLTRCASKLSRYMITPKICFLFPESAVLCDTMPDITRQHLIGKPSPQRPEPNIRRKISEIGNEFGLQAWLTWVKAMLRHVIYVYEYISLRITGNNNVITPNYTTISESTIKYEKKIKINDKNCMVNLASRTCVIVAIWFLRIFHLVIGLCVFSIKSGFPRKSRIGWKWDFLSEIIALR